MESELVTEAVHRPARPAATRPNFREITLQNPPTLPERQPMQIAQLLLPALGSATALVYGWVAHSKALLITGIAAMGLAIIAPISTVFFNRRVSKRSTKASIAAYHGYLDGQAEVVKAHKKDLRRYLRVVTPLPDLIETWVADPTKLWSRRLASPDFAIVCIGRGEVATGLTVSTPPPRFDQRVDPDLDARCEELRERAATLDNAPVALDLRETSVLSLEGERAAALSVARTVILQLAASCGPDELSLVLAYPQGGQAEWDWAAVLPQVHLAQKPSAADRRAAGAGVDVLATTLDELLRPRSALLGDSKWTAASAGLPHVVLVLDAYNPYTELAMVQQLSFVLERSSDLGISVLVITDHPNHRPSAAQAAVICDSTGTATLLRLDESRSGSPVTLDAVAPGPARQLAQAIGGKRLIADRLISARGSKQRLVDLLDIYFQNSPVDSWPQHDEHSILTAPVGATSAGADLVLDLKEAADGGDGPHGLVVGATGSGKSELLRSIVCSLACRHAPSELNLFLVDFKGGATFELLNALPHSVGFVTNLADDLALIDRVEQALVGELTRRQEDLRRAGREVQKLAEYNALRATTKPWLRAIPHLVVVIDEFGELLSARADFLESLISIARTGRSLGVHLILASQRLEGGRLKGLDTYLSYRVCLRTFTAEESQAVLGTRDAVDLPPLPGHGYYRSGGGMVQFVASQVLHRTLVPPSLLATTTGPVHATDAARIVDWLSVLEKAPDLLLPPLAEPLAPDNLSIFDKRLAAGADATVVPVGLIDEPSVRTQRPMLLDFSDSAGHHMLVGGPRSGKSTAVRSIIGGAAMRHSAASLQFYVVESAPNIAPLRDKLCNVAAAATLADGATVRRLISHLVGLIDQRTQLPVGRRATAAVADGNGPSVVLVIDGYLGFREKFPDLEEFFARIIADGPHCGVHAVVTSGRWMDMQPKRLEQIADRFELWLTDPIESMHPKALAAGLRRTRPGRGLTGGGLPLQIAGEPVAEGDSAPRKTAEVFDEIARIYDKRWPGVKAEQLTFLQDVDSARWAATMRSPGLPGTLTLGISEIRLERSRLPVGAGQHLVLTGDSGGGRTSSLAAMLESYAVSTPTGPIYVFDFRGRLAGLCLQTVARDRLVAARDGATATKLVDRLATEFSERDSARLGGERPAPPPMLLVIDDYELVVGSVPRLLDGLSDCMPYGRELHFTMLLSQAAYGAGARVDTFMRRVLESGPYFLEFNTGHTHDLLPSRRRGRSVPFGQAYLVRGGHVDEKIMVLPPEGASTFH